MTDCVFCRIGTGEVEASVIVRRETAVAFVDRRQPRVGHALVVPVMHVEDIFVLPDALGAELFEMTTIIARAARDAFQPDGVSVWSSNGPGAGQEVAHFHLHVMPRWDGDGMLQVYVQKPAHPNRADLDEQAASIRRAIAACT